MSDLSSLSRRGRRLSAKALRFGKRVASQFMPSGGAAPVAPVTIPSATDTVDMVVVVTGSTRGVGRAIANGFVQSGARVVVNGRNETATQEVAKALGGQTIGIAADMSTGEGVDRLFAAAIEVFGRVDVLVNNAGIAAGTGKPLWDMSRQELADNLQVNVTGPFLALSRAIQIWMEAGQGGRVLNVSSGAGEQSFPSMSGYGISKFALEGLTRYAAEDLAAGGIAVCSVKLGSLRTDMTRANMSWEDHALLPDPDTVAPVFVNLASAPAEMIHGRSFAAPRLSADFQAELSIAGPIAATPAMKYPKLTRHGVEVPRDWQDLTLLDRAENQWGPSPKVAEAVNAVLTGRPTNYYPDEDYTRLRQALAKEHGLAPECFTFGNGSWVLLDEILRLFAHPGDEVVSNDPGWFGFHILCPRYGVNNRRVRMRLDAGANGDPHNLDGMLAAIGPKTRLIYIVTPSNPEGVPMRDADFARFIEQVPPNLPVIVDEAYAEFADIPDLVRTSRWVQREDRMVIGVRTFSKFYALAGMRVGYSYARPEVAEMLARQSFIFSVNSMAEEAALAALADHDHRAKVHAGVSEQRRRLTDAVRGLGLRAIDSQGPFMMIEAPCAMDQYREAFSDAGLMLPFFEFYDGEYVMFPVASAEQNTRTLEVLAKLTGKSA
ncbi:MAG: SDR family NAD(P)-dependent oxidoreductase [Paracoccaceae bacterium]